ncbi:hypothetical protein ABIE44_002919 [Marmoricola sp. OAE513]
MYHRPGPGLLVGVTAFHAPWPEDLVLVDDPAGLDHVRSIAPTSIANEVGTWSLEYLGPGFHVQLRIARRQRQVRVDGWMSPAQPIKVFLTSLLRHPVVLEAQVSDSGRFEFPTAPNGACRMSFVLPTPGRPPATPPFWI